jgi:mannobiose 2-epimerase
MIHILECFTELYKVWPDKLLKERLNSVHQIIRDKIVRPEGYVNLFFQRDWTPISFKNANKRNYEFDHISFGHDVEIAFLLLEASEVLGIENDSLTLSIAKKLVDHSIENGFDSERGGIFDRGYYMPDDSNITIIKNTKEWWAQAEALNSFLLMSKLFPNDRNNYRQKFYLQWDYIKKYLIDHEHGGWFWGGIDIEHEIKKSNKASVWKVNYHTSRALINCLKMLSEN